MLATMQAALTGLQNATITLMADALGRLRTTGEPSRKSIEITPDDEEDVPDGPVRLWINTTGWIRVTLADNDDDTSREYYVIAGGAFPGMVKRVWETVVGGDAAEVEGML